jgi:hypothetical protein
LGRRITASQTLESPLSKESPADALNPNASGWKSWPEADRRRLELAVFMGLLGWFTHGLAEFGLYIPASAWTAFTLAGALLAGVMPRR